MNAPVRCAAALGVAVALAVTGCPDPGAGGDARPAEPPPGATLDKIKVKDGSAEEAFSLKLKADGAKLVDAEDVELTRLKLDADTGKVKIKGPDDAVLGYLTGGLDKLKLEEPDQETELFAFQRQDDGDHKLEEIVPGEDGGQSERLVYKIKRRDYGWEVLSADGAEELYKVKVKGEKTSLRRASDSETLYYTKDPVRSLAMACLGLDRLSRAQQAALLYRIHTATPE